MPPKVFKLDYGGQYRVIPSFSNFDFHPLTLGDRQQSQGFAAQRMRLWLDVQPHPEVGGYVQVEIGHILWGDSYEFPKTYFGFRSPPADDRIGIELRRGWVYYQRDDLGKFRMGILDWSDSFDDTLASADYDFNVGGVDWSKTFPDRGGLKLLLGGFVLSDDVVLGLSRGRLGHHNAYLFTFDADQPLDKVRGLGLSAYYLADNGTYSYPTVGPYRKSWDVWLGLRGRAGTEAVPVRAFVLLNFGERDGPDGRREFRHLGWAGKVGVGPVAAGPGKVSAQVLASTGDDAPGTGSSGEFRTVAQSFRDNFGSQGYWSHLHLTSPNGPSDLNDLGVSLQNRGLGLFTVQGKYELPVTDQLTNTFSTGWLRSTASNPRNGARGIGTELADMWTYDLGGGLKVDLGAAVLFTGDFYRAGTFGPRPEMLWEAFSRVQLEF